MSHMFAVMWDCDGLEAIVDVTECQQQRAWAMLKGIRNPPVELPNLMHWQLRAQANPQRHYEIYVLESGEDVTVEDVRVAFEAAPQEMADTVRRIGHKFYSDRAPAKVRIR